MKIDADWLRAKPTQTVMRMLKTSGFAGYLVGGCVRNALLGAPVSDIDISTDAPPDAVLACAEESGLKAVPTGIAHGTVTLIVESVPIEVTSFRKDIETDGRHAIVSFSTDIAEDARRRDFTMNALYADMDGTVIDPLNGLPDLKARHVRFIDDPHKRISEDYLRILRFFRFTALYGDPEIGIDAEGLAACAARVDGLQHLSADRIVQEIRKLLSAPDPSLSVSSMGQAGVLTHLIPGASAKALPVLVVLEQRLGSDPHWIDRLAVVGGRDAAAHLKLSKSERTRLSEIHEISDAALSPKHAGYAYSADTALAAFLVRSALMEQDIPDRLRSDIEFGSTVEFPLRAADFQENYSGKALGQVLRQAEQRWIASDFTLTRSELLL